MKSVIKLTLAIAATSILSSNLFAQFDLVTALDLEAVKSMQFDKQGDKYYADVEVIFSSTYSADVKLDKGDFLVTVNDINLGRGAVDGLIIPKGAKGNPSLKVAKMQIFVGYDKPETISRMIGVFNVVGMPSITPKMSLKGECSLGAQVNGRGWASSNSMSIDFVFVPELQDEVLFQ